MSNRIYRVLLDSRDAEQWFLGDPVAGGRVYWPTMFTRGERVEVPDNLVVPVRQAGHPVDFTYGHMCMPVVTGAVGALIGSIAPAAVQRIPVTIEGREDEPWEILNVLDVVECLDGQHSSYRQHPDDHPTAPGGYHSVDLLSVREEPTRGHDIFMVNGWIALLVSSRLKAALEAHHVTGLEYDDVTAPGAV